MILQLKLTLKETEPRIWRRILVDDLSTLHQLHRMIQILMGWWDYHLYQFDVEGGRYHGPDDEPMLDEDIGEEAAGVSLRQLGLRKGDVFDYEYDFGDSWRMEIVVERRRQVRNGLWTLPWLMEGERAGPPEDCGGTTGLARVLSVLENPPLPPASSDPEDWDAPESWPDLDLDGDSDFEDPEERERWELLQWLGDYDPGQFDRRTANHFLVLAGAWGALDG